MLASFDLHVQVAQILPIKFQFKSLLVQEEKDKIDFQNGGHGCHLGFLIRTILAILIYKTP